MEHRKTRKTRMGKLKLALVTWFYSKQPTFNYFQLSTINSKLITVHRKTRKKASKSLLLYYR